MATVLWCLVLLLAMTGQSSGATYCICRDGVSESVLQKNIDYACGSGADCSAILSSGACYNPNTVKDHCNYAVNSYFQKKGQVSGSCDFSSTAATTQTLSSQSSTCVYPSSASSTTPTGTTTSSSGTTTGTNTFGLAPTGNGDVSKAFSLSPHQNSHLFFWPFTLTLLLLSDPIMVLRL